MFKEIAVASVIPSRAVVCLFSFMNDDDKAETFCEHGSHAKLLLSADRFVLIIFPNPL